MFCKYFCSTDSAAETVTYYNEWAKNKTLARDVIIHSHVVTDSYEHGVFIIAVFFDERIHPEWVKIDELKESLK